MNRNLLLDGLLLGAVALLAIVTYQLLPLIAPRTDVNLPLSDCDLNQGSCQATLPEEVVLTVSIAPRPIPVVKPLHLEMTLSRPVARQIEVDFAGVAMQMGYNRIRLLEQPDGLRFVGQGDLPVCVTGAMQWQATVIVKTDKATIGVPFRFFSGH